MKKTILYLGNFSFPFGNAAGKRVYANGKIFKDLGFEVIFIGMDKGQDNNKIYLKNGLAKGMYDGFTYYTFPYPNTKYEWINFGEVYDDILEIVREEKIEDSLYMIITYGSLRLSWINYKLLKYSHINKVKFLVDSVDWLSVKTKNPIFNFIKWADNYFKRVYIGKHADGIITISKFLSNYYKNMGKETVVIPPLSPDEPADLRIENKTKNAKIITYAGQPFRIGEKISNLETLKDRIDKTLLLLNEAKKRQAQFKFQIYGISKADYLFSIPSHESIIEELGENVSFYGMVPNETVLKRVAESDFTILIRDVNVTTMAGFPTKVAESISCGTPVITTKTSDLEDYIVEGKNGFFIDISDKEKAIKKICDIFKNSEEDLLEMKVTCINSNLFFYKSYCEKVACFINRL